jgi:prolipoprotein diacylglyceryl transferase
MSIPSPPAEWQSFTIGIFTIHIYALCILAGIIVALIMTSRRLTKRGAEPGVVFDFAIGAVVLGIIGARLYHVFTHPGDYFGDGRNFGDTVWGIVQIWNGGNAIFGSLIGGALGVLIASRITGVKFLSFADAVAPGLLLAQAIGRLGNYFNVELYGQPTTLPWGLEVPSDNLAFPAGLPAGTLFHPTFLYELLWNTLGAILILLIERQFRLQWGKVFALYLIWYGAGRIWFESIRVDPSEIFLGLRVNIWGAIIAVAVGVILFLVQRRRHKGVELSVYRPGKQWVNTAKTVDSGYSDSDFAAGNGAPAVDRDSADTKLNSADVKSAEKPVTSGADRTP